MNRILALCLLLLAACPGDPPSTAPASSASVAKSAPAPVELGTKQFAATAPAPSGKDCSALVPTSRAAAWLAGPFEVPGDDAEHSFVLTGLAGPVLVAIQNGDGLGTGGTTGGEAWFSSAPERLALPAGQGHVAGVLTSAEGATLTARFQGGGTARVTLASAAALPCPLLDTTVTRGGGTATTVTKSVTRPDEYALALLMVEPSATAGTSFELSLNSVVVGTVVSAGPALFLPVALNAGANSVVVRATGTAGGTARVRVLDLDTTPPAAAITTPVAPAMLKATPGAIKGTRSADVKGVDLGGAAASLGTGTFSGTVALESGPNGVVVSARDFCGNVVRDCRVVTLDMVVPAIDVTGVEDGAQVYGPVNLAWTVVDEHLASAVAKLNGVEVSSPQVVSNDRLHTFSVVAKDLAGNQATKTVRFTVDTTPPTVSIGGVAHGKSYRVAVKPTWSVTDANLLDKTGKLDGDDFVSGTTVDAEGDYRLEVWGKDRVGNEASKVAEFSVDYTPPVITVNGIDDGDRVNHTVTPEFSATDLHGATVTATLNGAKFLSGTPVTASRVHTLIVKAVDPAGNPATTTVGFTVDQISPVISLTGVSHGQVLKTATPRFTVTDTNLGPVTATLNGAPFATGTVISEEGEYRLVIVAPDTFGNTTTKDVSFAVDRAKPVPSMSGVTNGAFVNQPPTLVFGATDLHLGSVVGKLDGAVIQSGHVVETDGAHTLVVTATDRAGNTASTTTRFTLDQVAPTITVTGVTDGQVSDVAVRPVFSATDPTLATVSATLDGYAFKSGTSVPWGGSHVLLVTAVDKAGNLASKTVSFELTTGGPQIILKGVVNGQVTSTPVTPTWDVPDASATVTATLNGAPFDKGTTVSAPGVYTLKLVATTALSSNTVTAKFTIDQTPPVITIGGFAGPVLQGPVVVTVTVVEPNVKTRVMTLNGTAFTNSVTVTEEGSYLVAVTVTDKAGNTASQSASFTVDRTPPVINVAGVTDGEYTRAGAVLPTFTITDANPGTQLVSLNGVVPFLSGDAVTGEDTYVLHLEATDAAGNSNAQDFHFVIDRTPPAFNVEGVLALSDAPQTPVWSVSELHPKLSTATLDGAPFVSGTTVGAEGSHTLALHTEDLAGNVADRTETFVIDTQAPQISVSGVVDGERRNTPATIVFGASDAHLVAVTAVLDGGQFTSGGEVSGTGSHTLVVTATDSLGHATVETRTFVIETQPPVLTVEAPAEGLVTKDAQVEVVAVVTDDGPIAKVTVGGVELTRCGDGKYRLQVSLAEGQNALQVQALDAAGNQADPVTVTVMRDTTAPSVSLTAPGEGARSTSLTLEVAGTATDATKFTLTVGGAAVTVQSDGTFSHALTLTTGASVVTVRAVDGAGNATTVTRGVRANATAPVVTITEPVNGATTVEPSVTVRGTVTVGDPSDTVAATVTVDGVAVTPEANGAFTATVTLPEGTKEIRVAATDGYGLQGEASSSVTRLVPQDAGTVEPPDAGVGGEDVGAVAGADAAAPAGPDAAQPPGRDAGAGVDAGVYQATDTGPRLDGGPVEPAPVIALSSPSEGLPTNAQTVTVTGTVTGGTLPLTADVNGVALNVSGRSFNAVLTLAEGDHSLTVTVTDRDGRTATAQRSVSVDRTAPYLTVDVPASNPATVTTSPFRLEGTVGDGHLSSVTVSGSPATILAGRWGAWVTLSAGENTVTIEARDEAGNSSAKEQVLNIGTLPPTVSFLEPYEGAEAAAAIQHVRVQVSAAAAIADVQIGAGGATQTTPGTWEADVALALGDNVITATATDVNGATGTKSITVHYRDETTEPLAVTGVNPAQGTMEVEPNALVSVGFNKEIDPVGVEEHFKVLARGVPLEGEYLVARGAQIVTFAAKEPLPEGEVLTVRVWGTGAVLGPSQVADFASQFTVRRPLTLVRGLVVDDSFRPLAGVKVDLGDGVVTRTGTDGNWATFAAGQGTRVVTYEGGTSADGRALPTVKRKIYVTPEQTTVDRDLVLTATDGASAQYVDATQPVTLTFNGLHGALSIGLESNSLAFPSGAMSGYLTATEVEPYTLPVPLEGRAALTKVWQVGPGGTHVGKDVTLRFPNASLAPAGRLAILLAYDDSRHVLNRVGLGRVTSDGSAIQGLAPIPAKSLEFVGYMLLDEAMSQAMEARVLSPTGGISPSDGGASFFELQRWRFAQLIERPLDAVSGLFVGTARAQFLLSTVALAADEMFANTIPAVVLGKVRAPRQRQLQVEIRKPEVTTGLPDSVTVPYDLPVSFEGRLTGGEQPYPSMTLTLRVEKQEEGKAAVALAPQPDWTRSATGGQVEVDTKVPLDFGHYLLKMTVAVANGGSRDIVYAVDLVPDASDAGSEDAAGTQPGWLRVGKVSDSSSNEDEPFEGIPVFENVGVEVLSGGNVQRVATGPTGGYAAQVFSHFGEPGLSCTSFPLGYTMLSRDGVNPRFEHVLTHAASCSAPYNTFNSHAQQADILVDTRFLWGTLTFVNREGEKLPLNYLGEDALKTELLPETGEVKQISPLDVETTEVHFFRADDPTRAIAPYTTTETSWLHKDLADSPDVAPHHGAFGRIWMGPLTPLSKAEKARCGDNCDKNYKRLNAGEKVLVVAVNHATGYTGMTRVTVPPITRGHFAPDGSCPEDVAAGGPIKTTIAGQSVRVSRCTRAELGIRADVVLYPPEVEVRVLRQAQEDGVRREGADLMHLVRTGGAATSRDDYVAINTRWRVRATDQASDAGVTDAEVTDAEVTDAESVPDTGPRDGSLPTRIMDKGDAGILLEHLCVERAKGPNDPCMEDDSRLTDVPAGVPPLAGHYISVKAGAAVEPSAKAFLVPPGRKTLAVEAARKWKLPDGTVATVNDLEAANWYVHVVGNRLWSRPSGQTFWSKQFTEGKDGVPPPIGEDLGYSNVVGLPSRAVMLKNVYRAIDPDGVHRERFDRSREHEFRVLKITDPKVTVTNTVGGTRDLGTEKPPAAKVDDSSYELIMTMLQPEAGRATTTIGDFVVRLGSDSVGIECRVESVVGAGTSGQLKAVCDGELLQEILTVDDILYLELFQAGNAENVLYRMNFNGISGRRDYVTASRANLPTLSLEKDPDTGGYADRPLSRPAVTHFWLSPRLTKAGRVRVCSEVAPGNANACLGDLLVKEAKYSLTAAGTYAFTDQRGKARGEFVAAKKEADGSWHCVLPLPSHLGKMTGSEFKADPKTKPGEATKKKELFIDLTDVSGLSPGPAKMSDTPSTTATASPTNVCAKPPAACTQCVCQAMGGPLGLYEGAHAQGSAELRVGDMSIADGSLAFEHTDMTIPEGGRSIVFSRSFDNQSNEYGTVGRGWRHNWEGYVHQETKDRYIVVLGGKGFEFPKCTLKPSGEIESCETDKKHPFELTSKLVNGKMEYRFRMWGDARRTFIFQRPWENQLEGAGRARYLLEAADDGFAASVDDRTKDGWIELTYKDKSNLVSKVQRRGSKFSLKYEYYPVSSLEKPAGDLQSRKCKENFELLKKVEAKYEKEPSGGPTTVPPELIDSVFFKHDDSGNLTHASRCQHQPCSRWQYRYRSATGATAKTVETNEMLGLAFQQVCGAAACSTTECETAECAASFCDIWNADLKPATSAPVPHYTKEETICEVRNSSTQGRWVVSGTDTGTNQPRSIKDPSGAITKAELDERHQWTSVLRPTGTTLSFILSKDLPLPTKRTDAGGPSTTHTVHAKYGTESVTLTAGRAGTVALPGFTSKTLMKVEKWNEVVGRAEKTVVPTVSCDGTKCTEATRTQVVTWEPWGGAKLVQREEGAPARTLVEHEVKEWTKTGHPKTTTDWTGTTTTTAEDKYNGWELPDERQESAPWATVGRQALKWTFEYDDLGRVKKRTTAETGQVETFVHDGLGRLIRYVTNGAPGKTIEVRYTALPLSSDKPQVEVERIEAQGEHLDAATPIPDTSVVSKRKTIYVDDRPSKEWWRQGNGGDYDASREYFYLGDDGPLLVVVEQGAGEVRTTTYGYNSDGTLAGVSYSGGGSISYSYVAGRVSSVTDVNGATTTIANDALERPVQWTYGTGAEARQTAIRLAPDGHEIQRFPRNGTTEHIDVATEFVITSTGKAPAPYYLQTAVVAKGAEKFPLTTTMVAPDGLVLYQKDALSGVEHTLRYEAMGREQTFAQKKVPSWRPEGSAGGTPTPFVILENTTAIDAPARYNCDSGESDDNGMCTLRTRETRSLLAEDESDSGDLLWSHKVHELFDLLGTLRRRETTLDPAAHPEPKAVEQFLVEPRLLLSIGPGELALDVLLRRQTFDDQGRVLTDTDALGGSTAYSYALGGELKSQSAGGAGPHLTLAYDGAGRLTRRSSPALGTGMPARSVSVTYPGGGVVRETLLDGSFEEKELDGTGSVVRERQQKDGNYLETKWFFDGERVKRVELSEDGDSLQSQTTEKWDPYGRAETEKETFTANKKTRYSRTTNTIWNTAVPPTAKVTDNWAETTCSSSGTRTRNVRYDGAGNIVAMEYPAHRDEGWISTALYDAAGLLIDEQPMGSPARHLQYVHGRLRSETVSPGGAPPETTLYAYSLAGRLKSIARPNTLGVSQIEKEWDDRGLLTCERYGNGTAFRNVAYGYDSVGNLTWKAYGKGTCPADPPADAWQYSHVTTGELEGVTPPGVPNGTHEYRYDSVGRLESIRRPDGTKGIWEEKFEYGVAGRVSKRTIADMEWITSWSKGVETRTAPNGDTVKTLRQPDGTPWEETYTRSGGAVAGDRIANAYGYDGDGQLVCVQDERESRPKVTSQLLRDERGLLQSESATGVGRTYTAAGLPWTVNWGGNVVEYGYDTMNRLQSVTTNGTLTTVGFAAGGGPLVTRETAGVTEQRCYHPDGMLSAVVVGRTVVAPGDAVTCDVAGSLEGWEYQYDARGNVSQTVQTQGGVVVEDGIPHYDGAERLVGMERVRGPKRVCSAYALGPDGMRVGESLLEDPPGPFDPAAIAQHQKQYSLDRSGRTLLVEKLHLVADPVTGELKEKYLPDRTYAWDANWRLVSETPAASGAAATTYRWDADDTLRQVGGAPAYEYDWAKRRVSGNGRAWAWDGDRVLAEVDSSVSPATTLLHGYDTEGPVSVGDQAVLRDALGSLTGYATTSPTSYQPVRTDEWGKNLAGAETDDCPLCSVNNGVPGQSLPTLAYAGQHAEPGVGLLYAQQRWYDPKLGMFLSVDPVQGDLGTSNGLQLWGYANGNPLRYTDPTGEFAFLPVLALLAIGGEVGFFGSVIHQEVTQNKSVVDYNFETGGVSLASGDRHVSYKKAGIAGGIGVAATGVGLATGGLGFAGTGALGIGSGSAALGVGSGSMAVAATLGGAGSAYTGVTLSGMAEGQSFAEASERGAIAAPFGALAGVAGYGAGSIVSTDLMQAGFSQPVANGIADFIAGGVADQVFQRGMVWTGQQDEVNWGQTLAVGAFSAGAGSALRGGMSRSPSGNADEYPVASAGLDLMDPEDAFLTQYLKNGEREPGFYDVVAHGTPNRVVVGEASGTQISANALVRRLVASGDYKGGPVRLVSCSTGACRPGDPHGVAQALSNKLRVDVLAPSDKLTIWNTGRYTIGPTPRANTGSWVRFVPKKGGR